MEDARTEKGGARGHTRNTLAESLLWRPVPQPLAYLNGGALLLLSPVTAAQFLSAA